MCFEFVNFAVEYYLHLRVTLPCAWLHLNLVFMPCMATTEELIDFCQIRSHNWLRTCWKIYYRIASSYDSYGTWIKYWFVYIYKELQYYCSSFSLHHSLDFNKQTFKGEVNVLSRVETIIIIFFHTWSCCYYSDMLIWL